MCVNNPVPFHSDEPIIAYKVMRTTRVLTPDELLDISQEMQTPEFFQQHGLRTKPDADGVVIIQSICAGNLYALGKQYEASNPHFNFVRFSTEYNRGFHAYENLKDALFMGLLLHGDQDRKIVVKVELTDVRFRGGEVGGDQTPVSVYVADKCKFLEIME